MTLETTANGRIIKVLLTLESFKCKMFIHTHFVANSNLGEQIQIIMEVIGHSTTIKELFPSTQGNLTTHYALYTLKKVKIEGR